MEMNDRPRVVLVGGPDHGLTIRLDTEVPEILRPVNQSMTYEMYKATEYVTLDKMPIAKYRLVGKTREYLIYEFDGMK